MPCVISLWVGECSGARREQSHLLVGHEGAVLQGCQVAAEEASARPVMLTEDGAVHIVESVPRHQTVPTCGTCETLQKGSRGELRSD